MKVLLINPWHEDQLPPPAIGYLQSSLKAKGVDVIARNLQEAYELKDDYDLVGVSFHTFSMVHAVEIRNHFKGRLICGGHHPSALPEQMIKIGYDQVVIGEGEEAIMKIIEGNYDQIVRSEPTDINLFPFPDYAGLKFTGFPHGIPVISSRGCPFKCLFCGSSAFWGHKYKTRTAENVIEEIEHLKSSGYKTWIFYDDNFIANKKRALQICSAMDGSYIWEAVARAEDLDDVICNELYRAGCRRLHLGVESLSQDALDRMGKHTTVEKMLKGVECAEKSGIATMSLFLVGMPGDSFEDIEITRKYRLKSKITQYGANIVWILPNTEIYRKAKEYGFDEDSYLSGVPFYTYEHSLTELQQWASQI